ncbi:MAG: trigger factor family protein [Bacteroidales bacterium]|nr:trigger factor family protein [Bacteroidales bacterium]
MKTSHKKIDALNIELTLEIGKDDYAEIERKKIAERKRTADFKGFRKGMVPEGMIRRVYGDQILYEAVNQVISKGLQDFIEGEKLNVLGEPLGSENQPEVEWKDGNDFTFMFDIALYPEVKVSADKKDSIPSYTVSISAKDKAGMKENLKKYYEGKKEEKSDADLDKEVSERLESEYKNEADWRLSADIRRHFVEKAKVQLPEAFLKRWLKASNEKVTDEQFEAEFPRFLEDFRWQLVRGAFMKLYGFKIEKKDIEDAARAYVTYQYAMYGMGNVPEDIIKNSVEQMLADGKQTDRLIEQVEDSKVLAKLKEEITIAPKKITSEKFRELK